MNIIIVTLAEAEIVEISITIPQWGWASIVALVALVLLHAVMIYLAFRWSKERKGK